MKIVSHPFITNVIRVGTILVLSGSFIGGYLYIEDQRRLTEAIRNEILRVAHEQAQFNQNWLDLDKDAVGRQDEVLNELREKLIKVQTNLIAVVSLTVDLKADQDHMVHDLSQLYYLFGRHSGRHDFLKREDSR